MSLTTKKKLHYQLKTLFDKRIKYQLLVVKEQKRFLYERQTRIYFKTQKMGFNKLNNKYTFDNFIVGSNNEFAKTASESVANNPGQQNF